MAAEYFIIKNLLKNPYEKSLDTETVAINAGSYRSLCLTVRRWTTSMGLRGYVVNINESFRNYVRLKDKCLSSFLR